MTTKSKTATGFCLGKLSLMHTLSCCADASVAVDVFTMVKTSPQLLQLENCCQIVSCLQLLLFSAHSRYAQTAVETALMLVQTFGDMVSQACKENVSTIGVDLSFEERRSKCALVRNSLKQLCPPLQSLKHESEPLQSAVRKLLNMLTAL